MYLGRYCFKDNSYFSRFFKKYVGVSPDEYRKS
ncbi:AraC family transcriptional regulator [Myroides odoratimimus]|nr:AraC family transcriptional regulator [Myroides odoratimimus]